MVRRAYLETREYGSVYAFSSGFLKNILYLRSETTECWSGQGVHAEAAGGRAGERRAEATAGGATGPAGGQGFNEFLINAPATWS